MITKAKGATLTINGEPVNGLFKLQEAVVEEMTRDMVVSEKLLGKRRNSTLSEPGQTSLKMDMVRDPVAWAKFMKEVRQGEAERRRTEIRAVLRALVPAEDLSEDYFDHVTEHHIIVMPISVADRYPALRSFDFVRAHDLPDERVYIVDGRSLQLADFGTPAGYPHKRATKLTDLVGWGEQED